MQFGASQAEFLIDSPDAVAQAVLTRLRLTTGEWFVDTSQGTPWVTQVLGVRTQNTRDQALRARMSGTEGVNSIISYSSTLIGNSRQLSVNARLDTIYGEVVIQGVF